MRRRKRSMIRRESAVMTLCKSVINNASEHSPSYDFSCEREMRDQTDMWICWLVRNLGSRSASLLSLDEMADCKSYSRAQCKESIVASRQQTEGVTPTHCSTVCSSSSFLDRRFRIAISQVIAIR